MAWLPNEAEMKYVELVASMCISSQMGQGVVDCRAFTSNLRMVADQMDQLGVEDDGIQT